MAKTETEAGVQLTKKQVKNLQDFEKLMSRWDKDLCINAIAGNLTIMLRGGTKQNNVSEMSETGGFNPDNVVQTFIQIESDGGDW